MASPQIENGHLDIANTIVDKLCSYRLNGQEWQIVWVILRKTWGWLEDPNDKTSPKKKMDRISLSQFEKFTGINRCRCQTLLKGLIEKNIIKRTVIEKYNTQYITYGFQSDYDKWQVLPKSVTVTKKCKGVFPKSVTEVLPKSVTTKDTITKDTITKDINPCPQQSILNLYHTILPECTQHIKWMGHKKRMAKLKARWDDKIPSISGKLNSSQIEFWEALFKYIRTLDFLMGKKDWQGFSLDWLVTGDNLLKTIEGLYENKKN